MDYNQKFIAEAERLREELGIEVKDLFKKNVSKEVCQFHSELDKKSVLYSPPMQVELFEGRISRKRIYARIYRLKSRDYLWE